MKRILTLCIIYQDRKILLGMKKRGFGVGKWNGFGGHVEEAESTEEAVKREVFEEAGLKVKSLEKMGVIILSSKTDIKVLKFTYSEVKILKER